MTAFSAQQLSVGWLSFRRWTGRPPGHWNQGCLSSPLSCSVHRTTEVHTAYTHFRLKWKRITWYTGSLRGELLLLVVVLLLLWCSAPEPDQLKQPLYGLMAVWATLKYEYFWRSGWNWFSSHISVRYSSVLTVEDLWLDFAVFNFWVPSFLEALFYKISFVVWLLGMGDVPCPFVWCNCVSATWNFVETSGSFYFTSQTFQCV